MNFNSSQEGVWNAFVDSDGKLLLIPQHSEFTSRLSYNGAPSTPSIVRLLSDGTLDPMFTLENIPEFYSIGDIAQQSDGKYIISSPGYDYVDFLGDYTGLYRINNDGTRDNTFVAAEGGWLANCSEGGRVAIQDDGKIIAMSSCAAPYGAQTSNIVRLTSTGDIDPSFTPGTGFAGGFSISKILIQPDQKILVAGRFSSYNGVSLW